MSCFRHHDIRAKTRSTMTTATTFSRQRHWLTHVHHLELRTSRTRSRTRLRIYSSLLSCLGWEHPFVDKPIAITEPTVPRSWLLGLASELCQQRSYSILAESLPSTQKSGKRKKVNPGRFDTNSFPDEHFKLWNCAKISFTANIVCAWTKQKTFWVNLQRHHWVNLYRNDFVSERPVNLSNDLLKGCFRAGKVPRKKQTLKTFSCNTFLWLFL